MTKNAIHSAAIGIGAVFFFLISLSFQSWTITAPVGDNFFFSRTPVHGAKIVPSLNDADDEYRPPHRSSVAAAPYLYLWTPSSERHHIRLGFSTRFDNRPIKKMHVVLLI